MIGKGYQEKFTRWWFISQLKIIRTLLNLIQKHCSVVMEDIEICENIFVPDIFILKLKTVCTKPREEVNDHNEILQELKYKHQDFEFSPI